MARGAGSLWRPSPPPLVVEISCSGTQSSNRNSCGSLAGCDGLLFFIVHFKSVSPCGLPQQGTDVLRRRLLAGTSQQMLLTTRYSLFPPQFSDKDEYPYFSRIKGSSKGDAGGMAVLLQAFRMRGGPQRLGCPHQGGWEGCPRVGSCQYSP